MSDCNTCIWACRDGSCASWDCDYINQDEAAKVVYCKDCRKHNTDSGHVSDICPLTFIRGKAHGHEFDYQYCAYGERKEEQE